MVNLCMTFLCFTLSNPSAESVQKNNDGRYLIITHGDLYNAILPLAEWKHKKGLKTKVVKTDECGSDTASIKAYIQDAYDNWDIKPEYLLIAGDIAYVPTFECEAHDSTNILGLVWTDNYYVELEGGDYLADIAVGRFPVNSEYECQTLVNKTLNYERSPDMTDTRWFTRGTMIVREEGDPDDIAYYWPDLYYTCGLWGASGYTKTDTLSKNYGDTKQTIIDAVNEGRAIVAFRGTAAVWWYPPFDVVGESFSNSYKLPLFVSVTCGTAVFHEDSSLGESIVRAGTPTEPRGGVAFFGNNTVGTGLSPIRSVAHRAFMDALYDSGPYGLDLGYATNATKSALNDSWPYFKDEYLGLVLLGDPALRIWTDVPQAMNADYPAKIGTGNNNVTIRVTRGGYSLGNALVCVTNDSIYEYGYTDTAGNANLSIVASDTGMLDVTVTAPNCLPYEGTMRITDETIFLAYHSHDISDFGAGNGNGFCNPGETLDFCIFLKNHGTDTGFAVRGTLSTSDPYVTVENELILYGDIPPTQPVFGTSRFSLSASAPAWHEIEFDMKAVDTNGDTWTISIPGIQVIVPGIITDFINIIDNPPGGDGDGILELNESAQIVVGLQNASPCVLKHVTGALHTEDVLAVLIDSTSYFGNLSANGSASNNSDRFALTVSPDVPDAHELTISVVLEYLDGTTLGKDTLQFDFQVGGAPSGAVVGGPDSYGYYMYDNTDKEWVWAPTYDWMEIAPPGPGSIISAISDADDSTATLSLPFAFKYYGKDYDAITVSTNGFLAFEATPDTFPEYSGIPDPEGPPAMIAPLWTDLNPGRSGDIYEYYDVAKHRYIIEYKNVAWGAQAATPLVQAILYDPEYCPSPTGDGEIEFHYAQVREFFLLCTVGIEDSSQTMGLEYLFDNDYHPSSAPLQSTRAIKFTTQPPESLSSSWLCLTTVQVNDTLPDGDHDNHADAGETIHLDLTLKNAGSVSASSVTSVLRTQDQDVVISDSEAVFGSIGPGGEATNSGTPFAFVIDSTPGDTIIEFQLFVSANGSSYKTALHFTVPLIEELPLSPAKIMLYQNYPNPFITKTVISYQLPVGAQGIVPVHAHSHSGPSTMDRGLPTIAIYDLTGRLVRSFNLCNLGKSVKSVYWDGRDQHGKQVGSGVYFYKLEAGGKKYVRKLVKLR